MQMRGMMLVCLALAGIAQATLADGFALDCGFRRQGRIEYVNLGPPDSVVDEGYRGIYRVDTAARSVTANFTVNLEKEIVEPVSRFIGDVRAMSAEQIVFCEDSAHKCERSDVDTGRSSGWTQESPIVIDLTTMKMSGSYASYFGINGKNAWMKTNIRITGTCTKR